VGWQVSEDPDVTEIRGGVSIVTFAPTLDRQAGVLQFDRELVSGRRTDEDVRPLAAVLGVLVDGDGKFGMAVAQVLAEAQLRGQVVPGARVVRRQPSSPMSKLMTADRPAHREVARIAASRERADQMTCVAIGAEIIRRALGEVDDPISAAVERVELPRVAYGTEAVRLRQRRRRVRVGHRSVCDSRCATSSSGVA
jgi:hypothetical protein